MNLINTSQPLLTIAIPTVNRLSLMKEALASALSQTVPVDVILSDNGSSDGTKEYLASLSPPANLRLFRHDSTMPVGEHGAFLVSQLRTDWVAFLSDDDTLDPAFSISVLGVIEERPDVALVYTGCDITFGDVAVPAKVGPPFEAATNFFFEFMKGNRNICMCATAFRTADRRAIGAQPPSIAIGDMYYWTRILAKGGVVGCVAGHLANYSFYRRGVPTETNRTAVNSWTRESQEAADIMCGTIAQADSARHSPASIAKARRKFMALTTANQFAWNALRGARKRDLFVSFLALFRVIFGNLNAVPRVVAAIILPRRVLERRLLSHARWLAATNLRQAKHRQRIRWKRRRSKTPSSMLSTGG